VWFGIAGVDAVIAPVFWAQEGAYLVGTPVAPDENSWQGKNSKMRFSGWGCTCERPDA
jgi:hypothetical protein